MRIYTAIEEIEQCGQCPDCLDDKVGSELVYHCEVTKKKIAQKSLWNGKTPKWCPLPEVKE
jgi:hypothetical protein